MNFAKLSGNFANLNGKLATLKGNLTTAKGTAGKLLTLGLLAGAMAIFSPAKAQAQEVLAGSGPYARHDFYQRERIEAFRRHEAFERRQEFLRREEFRRFHRDRFYR